MSAAVAPAVSTLRSNMSSPMDSKKEKEGSCVTLLHLRIFLVLLLYTVISYGCFLPYFMFCIILPEKKKSPLFGLVIRHCFPPILKFPKSICRRDDFTHWRH